MSVPDAAHSETGRHDGRVSQGEPRARVIVVSGPSGSGKTRLAEQLSRTYGWPFVNLDDFYRDGTDPGLPTFASGEIDWDDPGTWNELDAAQALEDLCCTGTAQVPAYSIARSAREGMRSVELGGALYVVAEGIFAPYVIRELAQRDVLAEAWCLRRNRQVTALRRFVRDVAQRRKPLGVLIRRGWRLWQDEPTLIALHTSLGATPVGFAEAADRAANLANASRELPAE